MHAQLTSRPRPASATITPGTSAERGNDLFASSSAGNWTPCLRCFVTNLSILSAVDGAAMIRLKKRIRKMMFGSIIVDECSESCRDARREEC